MPRPGSAAEVRIVEAGHLLTTTIPGTSPRYPASPAPSSHGHALAKVQRDVDEGREELNYSEWTRRQEGEESAETVREGSMPPSSYLLTHPEARLTDAELTALADGLAATFGEESEDGDGEEEHEEDD